MSEEQIEQVRKDLESVLDTTGWPKTIEKAILDSRRVAVQYFIVSLNKIISPLEACARAHLRERLKLPRNALKNYKL